jgi:hypothetical protein
MGRWRMDRVTPTAYLREVILNRFPPGPDREQWLAWLTEFSHAEETLETLSGLLIGDTEEPSHTH